MKRLLIRTLPIFVSITATGLSAHGAAQTNVLGITCENPSGTLVLPESFETDTKKMLEGWYLTKYAVIDDKADSRPDVEVTDEVLAERLGKMPTEIEMPLNSVVKNSIMFYANRRKQLVENMLALGLYYMPIFETALDRYDMPRELRFLPVIESALEPAAVSRAGAVGLWQIMAPTAGGLGLEMNSLVDSRRDPYASTDAAVRYLKQLHDTYNDWSLAIAAYNCGPGNVNKALRRVGDGKHDFWDIYPFLPAETRGYFPAFIAANYIMTYYGEHNIAPALAKRPVVVDTVHVTRRVHFQQISDVMDIPMEEIRALNPQYRRDLIPGDIKPYPLVLPSLQTLAYIANEDSILNHDAEKYARRSVVEPASDSALSGSDSKGEYVDELVTHYHTVKRGETLAQIARKYGVSVSSIRKTNKIGKTVKRGKRLKIQTYKRRYVEKPKATTVEEKAAALTDSIASSGMAAEELAAPTDSVAAAEVLMTESETVSKAFSSPAPKAEKPRRNNNAGKTTTHTVKKGENLYKIATRNGITVDQLKAANGLTGNDIKVGQRLKIPKK
ncbi:MAG: transglycosylase SLT domain-containing protein [Muribaculaceae bacterium]|nr:transglycosylase SLT domain-containing protein [Muribaculaceae bacterium]